MVHPWGSGWTGANRRTSLIPQALGSDEFLRVTWHEDDRVVVFSQWVGDTCVAAIPVRVTDATELAELLVSAVGAEARTAEVVSTVVPLPPPVPESA